MSKKKFAFPIVFLSGMGTGEGPDPGHGTGQGSPDIEPWDFEMWSVMFDEDDSNGNGIPGEWEDYVAWMTKNGFEAYINPDENPNP